MAQRRPTSGGNRGFNIADFEAHRSKVGLLRHHDFHIEIPIPNGLRGTYGSSEMVRNVELACDSINFPATSLITYAVQRYSYGALETRPTLPTFAPLQATFMTDQNSVLWRFFHDWIRLAVNFDFSPYPTPLGTMDVYEISYKLDYCVDMFLYIYDPYAHLVRKIGFRQAYPVSVGDVPMNWSRGNELIKVPVQFTFFDWNEETQAQEPQGFANREPAFRLQSQQFGGPLK